jgi:hypothetical protein
MKSCPHCGQIPHLFELIHHGDFGPTTIWFIECSQEYCGVRPKTRALISREKVIQCWNTRAKSGSKIKPLQRFWGTKQWGSK